MAWQSPSAMAGGGGFVGSGDGGPNGGHPQGTEYTLQGVMRFLQTEWHRHERDRNAWEIERAEMKSRIGRLEGDVRTNKRLRESLAKHVRLLEAALKKEREKVKKLTNNEEVDDMRDPKEIARESLSAVKSQHPKLSKDPFDVDPDETQPEYRQENERDKSRLYLSKCSQEVTYHVIPALNPPADLAEQDLPNHIYGGQPMPQQSLEEAYMHQQRQKQQQQQQQQQQPIVVQQRDTSNPSPQDPSINQQFVDLGNRIQQINHATNSIIRDIGTQDSKADSRNADILRKLDQVIAGLDARMQRLEMSMQTIQRDLEGKDYRDRFAQLQETLKSSHLSLSENLQTHFLDAITASTPRMGFFIVLIISFQVFLAAAYIIYKRRRANAPKKFL